MPAPDWWGIGPEVPRHGPLTAVIAHLSQLLPGPLLVATAMALAVAVAFAGAARLAAGSGVAGQVLAGMLYGAGPFMLTRIGVGHLGLVIAIALLPWALPRLLRPGDDLRRTFLWSLAFSATGYYGASLAVIALATGLVADRLRRAAAVAATFVFAPSWSKPRERLALPWHQYFDLEVADERRVHHPLPIFLRGDVISSSDPELGGELRETADRREDVVRGLLAELDAGAPIAPEVERLGVRWIVVLTDLGGSWLQGLRGQQGLTRVLEAPEIESSRSMAR